MCVCSSACLRAHKLFFLFDRLAGASHCARGCRCAPEKDNVIQQKQPSAVTIVPARMARFGNFQISRLRVQTCEGRYSTGTLKSVDAGDTPELTQRMPTMATTPMGDT